MKLLAYALLGAALRAGGGAATTPSPASRRRAAFATAGGGWRDRDDGRRGRHRPGGGVVGSDARSVPRRILVVAYASVGDEDEEEYDENDDLPILTPGTYATSRSAKRRVEENIVTLASGAFESTDFEREPHLSPEMEDAEAAYESRLDADAARLLADAAERESRQSRAAMAEREREIDWIENHDRRRGEDGDGDATTSDGETDKEEEEDGEGEGEGSSSSSLTRTLYAAQLANESKARARAREAFHRAMLSARIANDVVGRIRASGGKIGMGEEGDGDDGATTEFGSGWGNLDASPDRRRRAGRDDVPSSSAPPAVVVAAPFATADAAAERAPHGVGIAPSGRSREYSYARIAADEMRESEADRRRNDRVRELWNCVHKVAIERTKLRMSRRDKAVDSDTARGRGVVGDVNVANDDYDDEYIRSDDDDDDVATFPYAVDAVFRTKGLVESSYSVESSVAVERGLRVRVFARRVRKRRSFLVLALAVVVSRRLFLAYFGNALRLI